MPFKVIVCGNSDELAQRGADQLVSTSRQCIQERGLFTLALSGGSTPEKMYKLLVADDQAGEIDWPSWRVYFGDERFVPKDDEQRSNYAMANRSLLSTGKVLSENLFAFDTTQPTVQASALAYERILMEQLGTPPRFDLVLLGMGDDGHTASLFPHSGSLSVQDRYVVDTPPGILPPPVDRMTVTIPVIQNARDILLMIGGEKKADALKDVLEGGASITEHPVASVLQSTGNVTFLVDEAAAAKLSPSFEVSR